MNSNFLNLNWKDLAKAAVVLFLSTLVASVYTAISATPIHVPTVPELIGDAKVAAIAAVSYLLKQLITNSNGSIGTEPTK